MTAWPGTLVITRDGYSESPPDRTTRSKMDVGPDKVRRRSTAAVRPVSFKMFLDDDQIDTLDDFYLDNDALVFDFTDPRTGDVKRARFTAPPNYDLNETMWNAMVKLEYLP